MADYISNYTGAQIDNAIGVGLSKGEPNGIASLDASGKVPSAQLPQITVSGILKGNGAGGISAAAAGTDFAPAGYGLGTMWNEAPSDDADLITGSGFQMAKTNVPFGNNWWGILSFMFDNSSATQWAMPQSTSPSYFGSVCKREKRNGTWSPWEWVNPPMAAGVEYRTTERYQGNPVYVKLVNFGNLPTNGQAKTVSYYDDASTRPFEISNIYLGNWQSALNDTTKIASAYVKPSGITIISASGYTAAEPVVVAIKYYK